MDNKTIYFMQSMNRTVDVGDNYSGELSSNPSLAAKFAMLKDYNNTAIDLSAKLYTSTKTATADSEALRDQSAEMLSIVASSASVHGIEIENNDLKALGRYTFSELRKCPLGDQINKSKDLYNLLLLYKVELKNCGIDDQMIDNVYLSIEKMKTASVLPQKIIDQHKNDNIQMNDHIEVCRKYLDKQLDGAMEIYRIKNMAFYLAYVASRKVRHHHMKRKAITDDAETTTGFLELLILDKISTEPIEGAMLTIAALNIETESDVDGETYNDMLPAGTYQAKLSYDGYAEVSFDFVIEAGKTCSKQFLMEKL